MFSSRCSLLSNHIIKTNYAAKASQLYKKKENIIESLIQQGKLLNFQRNYSKSACLYKTNEILEKRNKISDGPGLEYFVANPSPKQQRVKDRIRTRKTPNDEHPYLSEHDLRGDGKLVYLDVHGCQMNVSDTEVVWAILEAKGYTKTNIPTEADVWLIVTCAIRDGAEEKIWKKLRNISRKKVAAGPFRKTLKVGVLGCMAERLKGEFLEAKYEDKPLVDIVAGPDSYKDLPRLLAITNTSDQAAINVLLSIDETYADVVPSRLNTDSVTGFVSIQRGCDNMCSYCIVPFTRGQERSRPIDTIINEVQHLVRQGVKEVTLLGQNVNSYRDISTQTHSNYDVSEQPTQNSAGFKSIYKPKVGGLRFADLLEKVADIDPEVRIRFTSPHPKDFPDEVLTLINEKSNICSQLHLPAQCGSTRVLESMRRGYTREAYLELADRVKSKIPGVQLSGDMIAGFCGETEEEFLQTLSLMEIVRYNTLYTFAYSLREKTHAHRKLTDNVPNDEKIDRLKRMRALYRSIADELNKEKIGSRQLVLIEGDSKRSNNDFQGRIDGYTKVIFAKPNIENENCSTLKPGDYCAVQIYDANSEVLKGVFDEKTTLQDFFKDVEIRRSFNC